VDAVVRGAEQALVARGALLRRAEEPTHPARLVVMVDRQAARAGHGATDGAAALLLGQERVVRDAGGPAVLLLHAPPVGGHRGAGATARAGAVEQGDHPLA